MSDVRGVMIDGLFFHLTCDFCPEQYDVYKVNRKKKKVKQVGYVRLRHGYLSCTYPDYMGKLVYAKNFDDERPSFLYYEERNKYLKIIARKLKFRDSFLGRIWAKIKGKNKC